MSSPTLKIVTGAETEILHKKSAPVKDILDPKIQKLLPIMVETMRQAEGIGLAAPQVGLSLQLCVTEIDGEVGYFFNPKITSLSREKIIFEEGCLSLPGKFYPIERSETITLRYQDEHGKEQKKRLRGLLAICLQHELDHLNGILIVDRYKKQKVKKVYAL